MDGYEYRHWQDRPGRWLWEVKVKGQRWSCADGVATGPRDALKQIRLAAGAHKRRMKASWKKLVDA